MIMTLLPSGHGTTSIIYRGILTNSVSSSRHISSCWLKSDCVLYRPLPMISVCRLLSDRYYIMHRVGPYLNVTADVTLMTSSVDKLTNRPADTQLIHQTLK